MVDLVLDDAGQEAAEGGGLFLEVLVLVLDHDGLIALGGVTAFQADAVFLGGIQVVLLDDFRVEHELDGVAVVDIFDDDDEDNGIFASHDDFMEKESSDDDIEVMDLNDL